MSFKRFVEIGRVVLINYGEEAGKIAAIVDVIDDNRVLVHGPETGVRRQEINLKRCMLTDVKVSAKHNVTSKKLKALWKSEGVDAAYSKTGISKKRAAHAARAKATDFDRFNIMLARQARAKACK